MSIPHKFPHYPMLQSTNYCPQPTIRPLPACWRANGITPHPRLLPLRKPRKEKVNKHLHPIPGRAVCDTGDMPLIPSKAGHRIVHLPFSPSVQRTQKKNPSSSSSSPRIRKLIIALPYCALGSRSYEGLISCPRNYVDPHAILYFCCLSVDFSG